MSKGINPNLKKQKRTLRTLDEYIQGIIKGNRYILSEAMTLVESLDNEQREIGEQILNNLPKTKNRTIRIGITGSPGAGKSTFIEALGSQLTDNGKKIAVLAVDPSSTKSHGSILGDKTRMQNLSNDENAFIRPTASASILGGVARATKESIALCEAAGYEYIFVESVGVGQSETDVADLVDIYLLLLLPGGGDDVQGIKRGVVELADIIVINKYDGERKRFAEQSKKDFSSVIRLFHHDLEKWSVPVLLSSAIENRGIMEVLQAIKEFVVLSKDTNYFTKRRVLQDEAWVKNQILLQVASKANDLFQIDQYIKKNTKESDPVTISIFEVLQRAKKGINELYIKFKDVD